MTLRGLFVGLTTIDIHYLVDAFPMSNAKTVAGAFAMEVGGPATNAAITFAHLGGSSHLLSLIGQHPFTSFIEHELQQYHVALTDLSPVAIQLPTISSIVTTPGGQRAILTTRLSSTSSMKETTWVAHPGDYDIVLVDGFQMETCCRVAQQARQYGIPVVLDGGSWKEGMERLLPCVDIAICSEQFRVPDGGDEEAVLAYLARRGVRSRAITRGERPIIYATAEGSGEIAIESVEVVDTLGAGDILHGAFCSYAAKGSPFVAALQQASRLATRSCQSFGTRAWMGR
jgi:sugar/nucleoside kinase (ribokinase family)